MALAAREHIFGTLRHGICYAISAASSVLHPDCGAASASGRLLCRECGSFAKWIHNELNR